MAYKILWIDDNIEELRSQIVYLGEKGYEVEGATNGRDGLALLEEGAWDAILLDEMMPGMGGLETLTEIKKIRPHIPVIMITKSEAEDLMSRAIGRRIDDYLVKPVSPLQIQSALKRQLESRKLTGEQVTKDYLSHFSAVGQRIDTAIEAADWAGIYEDMVTWGLDLFQYSDHGLLETQGEQMSAANLALARWVQNNYEGWLKGDGGPTLSHRAYEKLVEPHVVDSEQVFLILIDCMRLDQWLMVEPLLEEYFDISRSHYWAMLPTATPYARNAFFAGLTPLEISRQYPKYWKSSSAGEGSRNAHESALLGEQLKRLGSPAAGNYKYFKMSDARDQDQLRKQFGSLDKIRLVAGVYNFLDIMAHGRSQSQILKELAPDEAAFRSLMRSWFEHSTLFEVLKMCARKGARVIVTTDHGSMLCRRSTVIKGNRDTSTNVRYKFGDNLTVDEKHVFLMKNPEDFQLPAGSSIENYVVTNENYYLVYPTNFHEYERMYRESFQHGGISLEEMICPLAVLNPR